MQARVGRIYRLIFLSLILSSTSAFADNIGTHVFEIRKSLPLKSSEVAVHDYYLDGGLTDGLKEGMIFTVMRRQPMHDPYQNKSLGDLNLPVARLQLIHVDKTISIARLYSWIEKKNQAGLDYSAIMIGDTIDRASLLIEKKEAKVEMEPVPAAPTQEIQLQAEPPQSEPPAAESSSPPKA